MKRLEKENPRNYAKRVVTDLLNSIGLLGAKNAQEFIREADALYQAALKTIASGGTTVEDQLADFNEYAENFDLKDLKRQIREKNPKMSDEKVQAKIRAALDAHVKSVLETTHQFAYKKEQAKIERRAIKGLFERILSQAESFEDLELVRHYTEHESHALRAYAQTAFFDRPRRSDLVWNFIFDVMGYRPQNGLITVDQVISDIKEFSKGYDSVSKSRPAERKKFVDAWKTKPDAYALHTDLGKLIVEVSPNVTEEQLESFISIPYELALTFVLDEKGKVHAYVTSGLFEYGTENFGNWNLLGSFHTHPTKGMDAEKYVLPSRDAEDDLFSLDALKIHTTFEDADGHKIMDPLLRKLGRPVEDADKFGGMIGTKFGALRYRYLDPSNPRMQQKSDGNKDGADIVVKTLDELTTKVTPYVRKGIPFTAAVLGEEMPIHIEFHRWHSLTGDDHEEFFWMTDPHNLRSRTVTKPTAKSWSDLKPITIEEIHDKDLSSDFQKMALEGANHDPSYVIGSGSIGVDGLNRVPLTRRGKPEVADTYATSVTGKVVPVAGNENALVDELTKHDFHNAVVKGALITFKAGDSKIAIPVSALVNHEVINVNLGQDGNYAVVRCGDCVATADANERFGADSQLLRTIIGEVRTIIGEVRVLKLPADVQLGSSGLYLKTKDKEARHHAMPYIRGSNSLVNPGFGSDQAQMQIAEVVTGEFKGEAFTRTDFSIETVQDFVSDRTGQKQVYLPEASNLNDYGRVMKGVKTRALLEWDSDLLSNVDGQFQTLSQKMLTAKGDEVAEDKIMDTLINWRNQLAQLLRTLSEVSSNAVVPAREISMRQKVIHALHDDEVQRMINVAYIHGVREAVHAFQIFQTRQTMRSQQQLPNSRAELRLAPARGVTGLKGEMAPETREFINVHRAELRALSDGAGGEYGPLIRDALIGLIKKLAAQPELQEFGVKPEHVLKISGINPTNKREILPDGTKGMADLVNKVISTKAGFLEEIIKTKKGEGEGKVSIEDLEGLLGHELAHLIWDELGVFDELRKKDPVGALVTEELMAHELEWKIAGRKSKEEISLLLNEVAEHVRIHAEEMLAKAKERPDLAEKREPPLVVYVTKDVTSGIENRQLAWLSGKIIGGATKFFGKTQAEAFKDVQKRIEDKTLKSAVIVTSEGAIVIDSAMSKVVSSIQYNHPNSSDHEFFLAYLALMINYALVNPSGARALASSPGGPIVIDRDLVTHLAEIGRNALREYQLKVAA